MRVVRNVYKIWETPEETGPLEISRYWRIILKLKLEYVRFEVLTAGIMKSSIFWDITPCIPLKVSGRFSRTCRLHLQGRKEAS
jgi:hypothetical protein